MGNKTSVGRLHQNNNNCGEKQLEYGGSQNALSLSETEISSLQSCWQRVRQPNGVQPALSMFQILFKISPEIHEIFMFGDLETCVFHVSGPLQIHAKVFTRELDFLIGNLRNPNIAEARFIHLGQQHAHMREKGFKPSHWETFARVIISCADDFGFEETAKNTWVKVIKFLMEKMEFGYDSERHKMEISLISDFDE